MPRRSAAQVDDARRSTVETAVDLASVVGLEGLTIGRLAEELGMSKSGLVGRFGSKQRLQLETLELAGRMFAGEVYEPAVRVPAGRRRLLAICDRWIAYLGEPFFRGGCFLTTATVEFDARPGPVRDAVAESMRRWLATLEREARTALDAGELPPDADPRAVAFRLNALAVGTNCAFQLHRDPEALQLGRAAMRAVLA